MQNFLDDPVRCGPPAVKNRKAARRGLLYSFSKGLQKKLEGIKILQCLQHLLGASIIKKKNQGLIFNKHSDHLALQPGFHLDVHNITDTRKSQMQKAEGKSSSLICI